MTAMKRRLWIQFAIFGALIGLAWATMDGVAMQVGDRRIDVRWIPTLVIAMFAFKAWIHHLANKIRSEQQAVSGADGRE